MDAVLGFFALDRSDHNGLMGEICDIEQKVVRCEERAFLDRERYLILLVLGDRHDEDKKTVSN